MTWTILQAPFQADVGSVGAYVWPDDSPEGQALTPEKVLAHCRERLPSSPPRPTSSSGAGDDPVLR